jgi:hypothetical protein
MKDLWNPYWRFWKTSVVLKRQRRLAVDVEGKRKTKDFQNLGEFPAFMGLWAWPEFNPASKVYDHITNPTCRID